MEKGREWVRMEPARRLLVVDDDPNDRLLFQAALSRVSPGRGAVFLDDGDQVAPFLQGEGKYGNRKKFPFPSIIFTDLKMQRMDGFAVLRILKQNVSWSLIPTLVLSSSPQRSDIERAYRLGANGYFCKAGSFDEFEELLELILGYWEKCSSVLEADRLAPSLGDRERIPGARAHLLRA